jgi:predicted phosphodiesterase
VDRIAVISDIHGNLPALEATLVDIRRRGISRILCLGDLVGKGPHPDAAVDRCREACEAIVGGNWEDWIAAPDGNTTWAWHRHYLGRERLAFLRALPLAIHLELSGRRIRLFHASPIGVYHRVRQTDPPEALLAMFEHTALTGDGRAPDVVGYGDIHRPYVRTFFPNRLLFNVGSVGNPLDTPQAAYAILEGAPDGPPSAPFGIQLVRVAYDIERAIQDAVERGMPELEPYARELRTAEYRGSAPAPGRAGGSGGA